MALEIATNPNIGLMPVIVASARMLVGAGGAIIVGYALDFQPTGVLVGYLLGFGAFAVLTAWAGIKKRRLLAAVVPDRSVRDGPAQDSSRLPLRPIYFAGG